MTRFSRPVWALFAAALVPFAVIGMARADTIQIRVSAGTDDAEEHLTEGNTMDITSTDLELADEGGGGDLQEVGMRFQNVPIPAGSTINSASIQFTTDEVDDEATSVLIYGQLSPNPSAFTAAVGDITSRPKTASVVQWNNIPSWLVEGESGPNQLTPNFASVVQEVVNQPGWAANNALAIIITPNPGGERTAESWDGDAGAAPLLSIDFTPVPEPSTIVLTCFGLVSILGFGWRRRRTDS